MSLVNVGNTCFLSTALQCIIRTDPMDRYLKHVAQKEFEEDTFITGFIAVHSQVRAGTMGINPKRLYECIFQKHAVFSDKRQHDCHEAILLILNMLAERFMPLTRTMHTLTHKDAIQSWCPDDKKYNIIDEIFKFQMLSVVQCTSCDHRVNRYQCEYSIFMEDLQLDGQRVYLEGYKCDSCSRTDTSYKVSRIVHFPPTMMVHLRNPQTPPPFKFKLEPYVYTLYAVGKYYGYANGEGGHYTACVKNTDDTCWTLKNDEMCMECPTHKVLHNACILFYDRLFK